MVENCDCWCDTVFCVFVVDSKKKKKAVTVQQGTVHFNGSGEDQTTITPSITYHSYSNHEVLECE